MNDEPRINNIPFDAPLFRKTPLVTLNTIIENLSRCSYHYADDSAKEWGRANELLRETADTINRHEFSYSAIRALYSHLPQLVTFDQLINAILLNARKS